MHGCAHTLSWFTLSFPYEQCLLFALPLSYYLFFFPSLEHKLLNFLSSAIWSPLSLTQTHFLSLSRITLWSAYAFTHSHANVDFFFLTHILSHTLSLKHTSTLSFKHFSRSHSRILATFSHTQVSFSYTCTRVYHRTHAHVYIIVHIFCHLHTFSLCLTHTFCFF